MGLNYIDLQDVRHNYFLGFVWGDGSLYRRKNRPEQYKLSIEISERDVELLEKMSTWFDVPSYLTKRTRDTNFSDNYTAAALTIHTREFCQDLLSLGLTSGRKSESVVVPDGVMLPHFYRGLLDADGSLGVTGNGYPFVSLSTKSGPMAGSYTDFLVKYTGYKKVCSPNQRDQSYNLVVLKEHAQGLVSDLWGAGGPRLARKEKAAKDVLAWERPDGMRVVSQRKAWSPEDNKIVMGYPVGEAAALLSRSQQSVISQRARLRRSGVVYSY